MSNDTPVTNAELNQFYGKEPSQIDVGMMIGKAASDFDEYELSNVVFERFEDIASVIDSAEKVGQLIINLRKQWIADTASALLYGRPGIIQPSEVNV